jgi:NADPH:quinone reductase-like Zn-dependent oxidoreductase
VYAVQFHRLGSAEALTIGAAAEPHAGPRQVRIRVMAAGVSPVDLALRAGRSPSAKRLALPHIPGIDAAGIVDETGADVTGVAVGDEVFGAVDVARLGGATAEFAVLSFWAAKPVSMPWDQAGASGTSIETATRALDLLHLRAGSTLLIDGAAGGVGSVAVQLAIARGVRVIGTGSSHSQDFIARLGASPVLYGPGLSDRVGRIDRALDLAGAGSLAELVDMTGSTESVVTIADFGAAELGVRISLGELGGQPDGRHGLAAAAQLFEEGRFHLPLREVFPFSRANDAHALAERGPRQGKVALTAP